MEHVEEILFSAERALQRRYPSKAKVIADTTKELWHRGAHTGFYCAMVMGKAIGVDGDLVSPYYYHAETEAEMAEVARQQAARERLHRKVMIVGGAVAVAGWFAGCVLVALYAA